MQPARNDARYAAGERPASRNLILAGLLTAAGFVLGAAWMGAPSLDDEPAPCGEARENGAPPSVTAEGCVPQELARLANTARQYAEGLRDLQREIQASARPAGEGARSPRDPFAVRTELVPVFVETSSCALSAGGFRAVGGAGAAPYETEEYAHLPESGFHRVSDAPFSTFAIDVDTASYANVRRFLRSGRLPPPDAVRIEELINYFRYEYPPPVGPHPFSVALEVHKAPWHPTHRLVRIGLRGRIPEFEHRPAARLVFLVDVSGSMSQPNKLPLVQRSLRLLVDHLGADDRVAMVVYAGSSGLVLPSTAGDRKAEVLDAIDRLRAGGSTNGGEGIDLAYRVAGEHYLPGGANRVILCTDGDFNVGTTSEGDLVRLIEARRETGVFLSVLGFGSGNYAEARMQALAGHGNGNAAYIDGLAEARKVLVEEAAGTLITIAQDVKLQVEFNPARVAGYRLIGYENRRLATEDFLDDRKDAGELGAGHQVTALYEIVPAGDQVPAASVNPLRYQRVLPALAAGSDEILTVHLRYKEPAVATSTGLTARLTDPGADREEASADFQFAAAVAMFGMLLRGSEHQGQSSWPLAIELAQAGTAGDATGWRREFVELARGAEALAGRR